MRPRCVDLAANGTEEKKTDERYPFSAPLGSRLTGRVHFGTGVRSYTQSDNPISGRLYQPKRNPLYNSSNYQTTGSLPGWSDGKP